ncbi:MAG TPA: sialidase family protein [Thermoanaerobaculia bacterium]|nr:sialidase family protein [Thermoanaerobaculia bacterium]
MRPLTYLALCGAAAALLAGKVPSALGEQQLTSGPGAKQTSINFARNVVAGPAGQVQVIWFDDRSGVAQVYTKRSLDSGNTWSPEIQLSQTGVRSEQPALARSGRHIYAAWHAYLPSGPGIILRRSADGGAKWGPGVPLGAGAFPSVAASGPRVRVVWSDRREGEAEVYTRGSADAAATWDSEVRLSDVPDESWVPTVELSGERAYVGWVDYRDGNEEEYFRSSRDGGATWEPTVRLTANPADSWAPSIAAAGEALRLAWFDRRDSGVSDADVERKLNEALNLLGLPAPPPPPRDPAVYYLPDFMARVQAKLQAIETSAPDWVAHGGDPARLEALLQQFQALMTTWTYSWEIYLKRSADGGATWGPDVRLTFAPGPSMRPSIAAAGRKVNLVWCDGRDGESQVYFKRSADGGATWGPDVRLTASPGNPLGDSMHPSLAMGADGTAYVVWTDRRSGTPEIYFQRLGPK